VALLISNSEVPESLCRTADRGRLEEGACERWMLDRSDVKPHVHLDLACARDQATLFPIGIAEILP